MTDQPPKRYTKVDGHAWQKIGEEIVVVLSRKRRIALFNSTASYLWDILDEPKTVEELSEALTHTFEVSMEQAQKDVETFIVSLTTEEIVHDHV